VQRVLDDCLNVIRQKRAGNSPSLNEVLPCQPALSGSNLDAIAVPKIRRTVAAKQGVESVTYFRMQREILPLISSLPGSSPILPVELPLFSPYPLRTACASSGLRLSLPASQPAGCLPAVEARDSTCRFHLVPVA
jgi:hypothetical protein